MIKIEFLILLSIVSIPLNFITAAIIIYLVKRYNSVVRDYKQSVNSNYLYKEDLHLYKKHVKDLENEIEELEWISYPGENINQGSIL